MKVLTVDMGNEKTDEQLSKKCQSVVIVLQQSN